MSGNYLLLILAIIAIALATKHIIDGFILGSIPIGSLLAETFPTYNLELFLLACFVFGAAMIVRYEDGRTRKVNNR